MNTLHERLKEERNRLGFNQDEFAEKGGVKRRAQIHYESGERCPDGHYFSSIAAIGADVNYILTGVRAQKTQSERLIEKMEILFYELNAEQQQEILAVVAEKKRLNALEKENALLRKVG